MARAQALGPFSTAFLERWIRNGVIGFEPALQHQTGRVIWDTSIAKQQPQSPPYRGGSKTKDKFQSPGLKSFLLYFRKLLNSNLPKRKVQTMSDFQAFIYACYT